MPGWTEERKGEVKSKSATHLQEVSHALEKSRDTGHCHGDGGRSHSRPSSPWPCRPQQVSQELRELKVGSGGLRGWRLGRPPRGRASCGSCVGGASTGGSSGRGWRWSHSWGPLSCRDQKKKVEI